MPCCLRRTWGASQEAKLNLPPMEKSSPATLRFSSMHSTKTRFASSGPPSRSLEPQRDQLFEWIQNNEKLPLVSPRDSRSTSTEQTFQTPPIANATPTSCMRRSIAFYTD